MRDMDSQNKRPEPVRLLAQPGTRLEELLASYESAKASAEEAADRLKAVTTAIKTELSACSPGSPLIELAGTSPGLPRLRLNWINQWKFDTKSFKQDYPILYVKYGHNGGHWDLRAAES